LYVTADDLGTQLGAYGHPVAVTPRIDRFAGRALLFERCYCQIAQCGPSRTSILTGLRPETTRVLTNDTPWRAAVPGAVTLGRHFRDAGYRTYAFGKISDPRNGKLDEAWTEQPEENGIRDTVAARRFMRHVARASDRSPFLLAIGFSAPHCPWEPTDKSRARYDGTDVLQHVDASNAMNAAFLEMCTPNTRPDVRAGQPKVQLSDDEVADVVRRFLASVTDLDTMFGQILATADDLGMLDNTIVIFWSGDHGFSLGDNGRWGKWTTSDSATRIPLIMSVPGTASVGRRAAGIVEAIDMFPTLNDLCGLPPPPQALDGLSFAPLFDDPGRPWKKAAFNMYGGSKSVKTERYNFTVNGPWQFPELYDLVEDPGETSDLSAARPDLVAQMRTVLRAGPQAAYPDP
jgi:arylsulfatase A-like enzyme